MTNDEIPQWALDEARKAAGIDVGNIESVPLALSMRAHARTLVELTKLKPKPIDEHTLDTRELLAAWYGKATFQAVRDVLIKIKARERGASGWIEWNGGENPVQDKIVEYRIQCGDIGKGYSGYLNWRHDCGEFNITHYRIID